MAQSRQERLDKQRERQRALRATIKEKRRPTRDDIARTLLHFAITENLKRGRERELEHLEEQIAAELVAQGFDRREIEAVFEELVDKYRAGWTFQRKLHLTTGNDKDEDDGV